VESVVAIRAFDEDLVAAVAVDVGDRDVLVAPPFVELADQTSLPSASRRNACESGPCSPSRPDVTDRVPVEAKDVGASVVVDVLHDEFGVAKGMRHLGCFIQTSSAFQS